MFRDDQAVRRNERSTAARVEANTGLLEMFKPLRRRLELIFFFELFQRRRIEEPHAFIGERQRGYCKSYNENRTWNKCAKRIRHGRSIDWAITRDKLQEKLSASPTGLQMYISAMFRTKRRKLERLD